MIVPLFVIVALSAAPVVPSVGPIAAATAEVASTWTWPVVGPVVVPFDPPDSPYGAGHRGIDIAPALGTPVVAPADGVVTFAGPVGGRLFVTIDHGGGVLSTASFLSSVTVRRDDAVTGGQQVGTTGGGHAGSPTPVLHFSVRRDDAYEDPLGYLPGIDTSAWVRLAPV